MFSLSDCFAFRIINSLFWGNDFQYFPQVAHSRKRFYKVTPGGLGCTNVTVTLKPPSLSFLKPPKWDVQGFSRSCTWTSMLCTHYSKVSIGFQICRGTSQIMKCIKKLWPTRQNIQLEGCGRPARYLDGLLWAPPGRALIPFHPHTHKTSSIQNFKPKLQQNFCHTL